jgi:hypothetical protein
MIFIDDFIHNLLWMGNIDLNGNWDRIQKDIKEICIVFLKS